MFLDELVLTCPAAPGPVLDVLADRGVALVLRGHLLAHPHLGESHVARLTGHGTASVDVRVLLDAARTPGVAPQLMATLLTCADFDTQTSFLHETPDVPGRVLATFADAAVARWGHLTRRANRIVALHPATPAPLRVQALRTAVAGHLRSRDIAVLLAAAVRVPDALADLAGACRNEELAQPLRGLAGVSDPAWGLVQVALRDEQRPWWSAAVRALAAVDSRAAAQVCAYRHQGIAALLTNTALPTSVRMGILQEWLRESGRPLSGPALAGAKALTSRATPQLAFAMASTATRSWHLPVLCDLDEVDEGTLRQLWSVMWPAMGSVDKRMPPVRAAEYAFQIAVHPACPANVRGAVRDVVLDYGCSAEADLPGNAWFSPSLALQALDDIAAFGYAQAALWLPVSCARPRAWGLSMHMSVLHMTRAAVAQCMVHLSDTDRARTFVSLAGTFSGTFAQLLDTTRAVTN